MSTAVTEQVFFNVNVHYFEKDGKHIALTHETGVIGVGATLDEAIDRAARGNKFLITEMKKNGSTELDGYLSRRKITYSIEVQEPPAKLTLASAQNTSLAAALGAALETNRVVALAA